MLDSHFDEEKSYVISWKRLQIYSLKLLMLFFLPFIPTFYFLFLIHCCWFFLPWQQPKNELESNAEETVDVVYCWGSVSQNVFNTSCHVVTPELLLYWVLTQAYAGQLCHQSEIYQGKLKPIVAINSSTNVLSLQVTVSKLEPVDRLESLYDLVNHG